ncbi:MAG: DUF6364 family protein [Desulfobacterales bacterium]|nr:DUF6364 family protein [Desulfobacterales bacterium]
MKQNITLSIEKDLIQKAKVLAAQRRSSISQMLSSELERMVSNEVRYNQAKESAIARLKTGFHLGGQITISREECHDR